MLAEGLIGPVNRFAETTHKRFTKQRNQSAGDGLDAVDPRFLPRANEEPVITRGLLSGDTAIDFLPKIGEDGTPLARGDIVSPGSTITGLPPVTVTGDVIDSDLKALEVHRIAER